MRIEGRLYSGRSSTEHVATLIIEGSTARFESSPVDSSERYELKDLNIHARLGSIPRVIETRDHRRFETRDFAAVETLERSIGKKPFVHRLESQWQVAIPIAVMLLISIVVFYKVIIPTYSRVFAPMVPMKVRKQISLPFETYLEKIHVTKVELNKDERERYDEAVAHLKTADPGISDVDLLDDESPNAFILPDDHIYVTKGMAKLVKSPDELEAVLLHEAGHKFYSHAMQGFIESSSLSFGFILISGGTEWTNVPIVLLQNTYSREAETQADGYAIARMNKLGMDPSVFADIFERLQQKVETKGMVTPDFMSTHPSFDERIKRIRALKKDAAGAKD